MPFPPFTRLSGPVYVSPTGIGRFFPTYHPDLGTLTIQVKMLWKWINHDATSRDWDVGSQNEFKRQFAQNVKTAWNQKWQFRCTKTGFDSYVAEPFFIVETGTDSNHHFKSEVRNCGGQSLLNAKTGDLLLHATDNDEYDNINPPNLLNPASLFGMSRGGVLHSEREKVAEILAPVSTVNLDRTTAGGWTVSRGSQAALTTFARNLVRVGNLMPKYPLTISASSGAAGKADAMVAAVLAFLRSKGADPARYPINTDATKTKAKLKLPFSGHKQTASVNILLADEVDVGVAGNWQYRYKVSSHEFGHCLGLPDEYTTYPPGGVAGNVHTEWKALCARASVAPNPYPVFNSSIMSCGWVTFPCHFVTVWDALVKLTNRHPYNIGAADWIIERGSQVDVL
jgi:hypothetical protein